MSRRTKKKEKGRNTCMQRWFCFLGCPPVHDLACSIKCIFQSGWLFSQSYNLPAQIKPGSFHIARFRKISNAMQATNASMKKEIDNKTCYSLSRLTTPHHCFSYKLWTSNKDIATHHMFRGRWWALARSNFFFFTLISLLQCQWGCLLKWGRGLIQLGRYEIWHYSFDFAYQREFKVILFCILRSLFICPRIDISVRMNNGCYPGATIHIYKHPDLNEIDRDHRAM